MARIYVFTLARRQLRNSISTSLNLMDEQRNGYIQMKLTIQVKKDNDSIRRILRVRSRDCMLSVELRRRLCITSILTLFVQKRFRLFGHAVKCPEGELIKYLFLPTPPRTWCRWAGVQLKTWATTIKAGLEPISGPRVFGNAQWRKDWVKVSSKLAQDRRAWSASVRDVVNAIGDAGSTRPGWMPTQVQVQVLHES